MKITMLASLLLITSFSYAQKNEVVLDSADNKAAIFSKSLMWVAKTWKNSNDVIQMKDEASGTIMVKGGLSSIPHSLGMPAKGVTTTQVTILVKDGKAKIQFDNTEFKWGIGTVWTLNNESTSNSGQRGKWNAATLSEQDTLIASFKADLLKKAADF